MINHRATKSAVVSFLAAIGLFAAASVISRPAFPARTVPGGQPYIRYQEPDFLTFEELKTLSQYPTPKGVLKEKLERFWTTPIISNEAYYRGARPRVPVNPVLGPGLTLATWNIEKSIRIKQAVEVWTSPKAFQLMLDQSQAPAGSETRRLATEQRARLMAADVIVLQEMDIGVKRSGYLNAAAQLAKALDMNYAYGAEQLEIDPVLLGTEKILDDEGVEDREAGDYYRVDPKQYRGVFGSAVLSRYPIKNVRVFQLKNQAYDWHEGEQRKIAFLEKSRRLGAKTVFQNELTREMKVGGRIFMQVDLEVPGLAQKTLTVVNIHLEIKCEPEGRQEQIEEILSYIGAIKNPVILAGDFNSAPTDLSPTSTTRVIKRTVKNPTTWLSAGVQYFTPVGLVVNSTRAVSNATKNFQNPLSPHIPVIAPNAVKGLFDHIKNFRFLDGGTFDFRGDKNRSVKGKRGDLANSNQRGLKGFKTTFRVRRPIGFIGKYRLDWIFVKSNLKDPEDEDGPYRFAPHFGETLEEMNTSLLAPVSDHHPNVVDLPFGEPVIAEDFRYRSSEEDEADEDNG